LPAGAVRLHFLQTAHVREGIRRALERRKLSQRRAGGKDELDLLALAARQRFARRDPYLVDRFALVVRALLAFGREGDEEARIEASRRAGGGNPVTVERNRGPGDVQVLLLEEIRKRQLAMDHQGLRATGCDRPAFRVLHDEHA
jgi:hypothetical protein